jgi:hypothetical protein
MRQLCWAALIAALSISGAVKTQTILSRFPDRRSDADGT